MDKLDKVAVSCFVAGAICLALQIVAAIYENFQKKERDLALQHLGYTQVPFQGGTIWVCKHCRSSCQHCLDAAAFAVELSQAADSRSKP